LPAVISAYSVSSRASRVILVTRALICEPVRADGLRAGNAKTGCADTTDARLINAQTPTARVHPMACLRNRVARFVKRIRYDTAPPDSTG
jgi:hypothetical protein